MNIKELNRPLLVRLLLRKLWQWQDAGGVSGGRSLESRLLESALQIFPLPEGDFEFSEHELIQEAEERFQKRASAAMREFHDMSFNEFFTEEKLLIPLFESREEFEGFVKTEYILTGRARINGMMISSYVLASVWDKFIRHPLSLRQLICSSQDTFEGFLLGAYPPNP